MGWWSEDIMGGDLPLDIEAAYEREFGPNKMYTDPLKYIDALIERESPAYAPIVQQVVGILVMQDGLPMPDELRTAIIAGIDGEDLEDWGYSEARKARLAEFKVLVEAYPETGGGATPYQTGLFEVIYKHVS